MQRRFNHLLNIFLDLSINFEREKVTKAELKNSSSVHVVERGFPSTRICPVCGGLTKHPLKERSYTCRHCGYHHPSRDVKAAQSILDETIRIYRLSGTESEESCGGQTL